ncbi:MAG: hypothetical protein OSB69_13295 [Alphaproteobacteria bacterium]|nr:hypothetical protein [Alphaproteobacteria bacterium]
MGTLLITGFGNGNGFELACQYEDGGCRVHAVCFQESSLGALKMLGESVNVHCPGVSDQAALVALVSAPRGEAIDLFINECCDICTGRTRDDDAVGSGEIYQRHADQRVGPGLSRCRV